MQVPHKLAFRYATFWQEAWIVQHSVQRRKQRDVACAGACDLQVLFCRCVCRVSGQLVRQGLGRWPLVTGSTYRALQDAAFGLPAEPGTPHSKGTS